MHTPAEVLWRVNNEYRKRLELAMTYLGLLEQLFLMHRPPDEHRTLATLRYIREQVSVLRDEHRTWRHQYYYENRETRRMIEDEMAIQRALSRFNRMRNQHEQRLHDLLGLLVLIPRPDPGLTQVPNGDLWNMTKYALDHLTDFSSFVQSLAC